MTYDARSDRHLASYFTRPHVDLQMKRYEVAEKLERQPTYFKTLSMYMNRVSSSEHAAEASSCSCSQQPQSPTCMYCKAQSQRANLLLRMLRSTSSTPSPFEDLAAKIPSRPGTAMSGTDRCGSALESRPSSASSRSSRSASARLKPKRKLERNDKNSAAERQHGIEEGSSTLKPCPTSSRSKSPKHVRFANNQVDSPIRSGSVAAVPVPPTPSSSIREPRAAALVGRFVRGAYKQPKSRSLGTLNGFMHAETFRDPMTLIETESVVQNSGSGSDVISRVVQETKQVHVNTCAGTQASQAAKPETFILLRFTRAQLTASMLIQRWYRGTKARKRLHQMQVSARVIQRAFRRFIRERRTAVAVWMLEKDSTGRWFPRTKYAQMSESSKPRVTFAFDESRFTNEDRSVVGNSSAKRSANNNNTSRPQCTHPHYVSHMPASLRGVVDFHSSTISSLGQLLSLTVAEPAQRLDILEDEISKLHVLQRQFVLGMHSVELQSMIEKESRAFHLISENRSRCLRLLQAKRQLMLLENVGRQQLVNQHATCSKNQLALSCTLTELCAMEASRITVESDWGQFHTFFLVLSKEEAVHRLHKSMEAVVERESLEREALSQAFSLESKILVLHMLVCHEGVDRAATESIETQEVSSLEDINATLIQLQSTATEAISSAVRRHSTSAI